MHELETQKDVLYWFVIVVVPILIGVFGLYYKQTKDKERAENRLTKIESQQEQNTKSIEKIEQEQFIVREDLKTLKAINDKQDMLFDMLKEVKEELKKGGI
ncbi:hypothetical protein [Nosocomiicoccus sp. HMSC059G07]|uniref:DUF7365 family protein n=1 Tax=Nosocomiicoccus sp. HMSC059G07 TaxID=1739531 RepID=UPI0008A3ED93|nr:hypothetical protein [Nosocomiicoccus sp. HMSC059G07]OFO55670.1 hypothetical protein HMPREF3029_03595 [Nosocomiicoccus sp. HMSC059G07]